MAKVWIKYDPFIGKTEFTVNDAAIDQNSGLYKYLDTPVEDWVDRLFPALVEHCNDDEIEMTFKGFLHYFQLLESVHAEFSRKNTEYDIELHYESSPSPTERKENLLKILAEIRQLPEMGDVLQDAALNEPMPVAVLGGAEEQRNVLIEMIPGAIEPVDAEAAIRENLVLYLLEKEWKQNDQRHMEWISEQFRAKTKHRRRRFLFIAEDVSSAVRMLSSEAGIKKAVVYSLDELTAIKKAIDGYANQICLLDTLKFKSWMAVKALKVYCEYLKEIMPQNTDQLSSECFEQEAINLLEKVKIIPAQEINVKKEVADFIQSLADDFDKNCVQKARSVAVVSAKRRQTPTEEERIEAQKAAFAHYVEKYVTEERKPHADFVAQMKKINSLTRRYSFTVASVKELKDYLHAHIGYNSDVLVDRLTHVILDNKPSDEKLEVSQEYYETKMRRCMTASKISGNVSAWEKYLEKDLEKYTYLITSEYRRILSERSESLEQFYKVCINTNSMPSVEVQDEFESYKNDIRTCIYEHAAKLRTNEENRRNQQKRCDELLEKTEQLQNELRVLLEI